MTSKLSAVACFLSTGLLCAILTGCSLTETATTHSPIPGPAISGVAFGGQQPITGAKVYLLAASPAGYGSASLSLLTSASTGSTVDSVGAYATTLPVTGGFNLAPNGVPSYDCTQGYALGASTASGGTALPGDEQVYLLIRGGNPGSGTNGTIGLLAALGPCSAPYATQVKVNELTTIATAYAFAAYATDATHFGSSGSALARTGIGNAAINAATLVSLADGVPYSSDSYVTRPTAALFTLANILASCVNGTTGNKNCGTLFSYTESSGPVGTSPAETATAAINLAHNPWPTAAGMTALFGLIPSTGAPFNGSYGSQPNDFTLGLKYKGGGLNNPQKIAIDSSGNAWITNSGNNSISEFSSTGSALSPATGYTGAGLAYPEGIAIDLKGNVWVGNYNGNSISELSSSGFAISTSSGFAGGGIVRPTALAIDGNGAVWSANGNSTLSKLSTANGSNGSAISPSAGYSGGGLNQPVSMAIDTAGYVYLGNAGNNSISLFSNSGGTNFMGGNYILNTGGLANPDGIALDGSNNIWTSNGSGSSVSKFAQTSGGASAVSPSSGYTGGGIRGPYDVAIDGAGNVWVANSTDLLSKFSNAGVAISPSTGYTGGNPTASNGLVDVAIDGSGDVWAVGGTPDTAVIELIGAAVPVVTPLAANLTAPYSTLASKP